MISPLEQFEIFSLIQGKFAPWITNFLITAFLATLVVIMSFGFFLRSSKIIPDRWQAFFEIYFNYILNILLGNAGRSAQPYFPFIFLLFNFVLICNLFGMVPFGYAITSQVLITFLLSCTVFLGSIFIGLNKHDVNFFSLFFPSGSPPTLAPLLVPIELLSFLSRPFSLGIRLFANMLAGHVLLKIMAGFIFAAITFALGCVVFNDAFFQTLIALNQKLLSFFHISSKLNSGISGIKTALITQPISSHSYGFAPMKLEDYNTYLVHVGRTLTLDDLAKILNKATDAADVQFYSIRYGEILEFQSMVGPDIMAKFEKAKAANPHYIYLLSAKTFIIDLEVFKAELVRPLAAFQPVALDLLFFPLNLISKLVIMALPLFLLSAFILLELGIAFLQAYVFVILTSIYVGDSINLH